MMTVFPQVECVGHCLSDKAGVEHRAQVNPPDAMRSRRGQVPGRPNRQAGFAHAGWADQSDKSCVRKAAFDFGELTFPSHEARQRDGKVTGPDGSNKAVTEAGDSLDVPGRIGRVAQSKSDLGDGRLDHRVAYIAIAPDSAEQLLFRDNSAGIQAEVLEHCKRLGGY